MNIANNWQTWLLLGWPVLTALASIGAQALDKTKWGHAVLSLLASLGIDLPKLLDAIKRAISPAARAAAGKTIALLLFVALSLSLQACLATAPIVQVTPANKPQIDSCTSIGALHNGFVVGDFIVGAGGVGVASAAAIVRDAPTKDIFAVIGIGLGAISAAGTAIVGFTGAEFSSSQCSNVVGPLPMQHGPIGPGGARGVVWVPDPPPGLTGAVAQ
jgi:hypothetical protein